VGDDKLNADEKEQPPGADRSQREYFDDGRSNPAATRPPVGGRQVDPSLPGEPLPGNEELYDPSSAAADRSARRTDGRGEGE